MMIVRNKPLKPVSQRAAVKFWADKKKKSEELKVKMLSEHLTVQHLEGRRRPLFALLPRIEEPIDNAPVYVLIRTSRRPEFFKRCMESVKAQTYPNIVTIVHSDDPRDDYVTGDIIIHGHCYHPKQGTGPYNLYMNRLLEAIPSGYGWYHFIDDDDMYASSSVIEKLVKHAKPHMVNVARVTRWGNTVFPRNWGTQRSYQTECFFINTAFKGVARWWANKGGDHYYSKQLTAKMQVNWIERVMIAKAQAGKSHGRPVDFDGGVVDYSDKFSPDCPIHVLIISDKTGEAGKMKLVKYSDALKMEKNKKARITFKGVEVIHANKHRKQKKEVQELEEEYCQRTAAGVGI